jgi:hypothetical protein
MVRRYGLTLRSGLLFPLLLIVWAVYLCDRAFYRFFSAYLVEVPETDGRFLPSPSQQPRGLLERQSKS